MILNKKQSKIGIIIFMIITTGLMIIDALFIISINPDIRYLIFPLTVLACSPLFEIYNIIQNRKSVIYNLILRIKKWITKKLSIIKKLFTEKLTLKGLEEIFIIDEPFTYIKTDFPLSIKELDPLGEEDWDEKDYETIFEKELGELHTRYYGRIQVPQPPPPRQIHRNEW